MEERWLFVIRVEIDPAVEEEWNQWYDEVHIPEVLEYPGFLWAERYVSHETDTVDYRRDGPEREYLSIYELTSLDALNSPEYRARREVGWGPYAPYIKSTPRTFRRILRADRRSAD
jgi:hypothetical protein